MKALIQFIVTLAAVLSKAHSQSCEDLDHQSCVDLLAADPNLCQDATLAATVCPNTCNNCGTRALNCYHCETPVTNYHDCNKTQQCQDGEKCLLAERVTGGSAIQEYILQCATEQRCNGGFGRRDVSTHCCSENLCNIPVHVTSSTAIPSTTTMTSTATTSTTTATTASTTNKFSGQITTTEEPCTRDIIVMVEDSKDSTLDSPIKSFLSNLVTMIPTGQDDSQFALYTFDTSVNRVFDFTSSQTEADLISNILSITFNHDTDNIDDIAVATAVNRFHRSYRGDRSGVPNAVVIISDNSRIISSSSSSGGDRRRFSLRDGPDPVQINTNDVIVINVGHSAISSEIFNDQAPDNRHIIDVVNVDDLQDELSRVRDLICY